MSAAVMLRPMAIASYELNGTRKLMPLSERELMRAETFMRRVLRPEGFRRGRNALIVSTLRDAAHIIPFERALHSMGLICCHSEANPYDGARIESTIRRFDVALVAAVTPVVLQAIRSVGFDPAGLFRDKVVWAAGAAYDELSGADGIDLRRWVTLGPALAIEGRHGDGAHVDGREWRIECEDAVTYVSSRLDRAQRFDRLRIELSTRLNAEPCPSGAYGPRIGV
jgi:hypothetical protein